MFVPLPKMLLPNQKSPKLLSDFGYWVGNNFLGKGTNMKLLCIFRKIRCFLKLLCRIKTLTPFGSKVRAYGSDTLQYQRYML
jgi:hypothetical protein